MPAIHAPGPFGEGEVGGEDDRGALVESADQMKQQLTAGLCKRQIAELVEHDEVHEGEVFGKPALPVGACAEDIRDRGRPQLGDIWAG